MGDCPDRRTVTRRAVGSAATSDAAQAPPRQAYLTPRRQAASPQQKQCAQSIPDLFESLPEERQDLVARRDRRLAGLVDQVRGDDAVRGRNVTLEGRREVGIRCTVRKHPPDEAGAEWLRIRREALRHAELVAREAV